MSFTDKYIDNIYRVSLVNVPMVDDVTEESRPSAQANGREMKIALVLILPTCRELNNLDYTKL